MELEAGGCDADNKVALEQMEDMDAEIAAVRQQAASQIAAAKKEAAAAREAAAAEAARSGAAHVASAVERETALSANLADLRAEYEVIIPLMDPLFIQCKHRP